MTIIQERLLALLKEIDIVCERNGLSYFLYGMTAYDAHTKGHFGADAANAAIAMPAAEALRLRSLLPGPGRALEHLGNNPDYPDFSMRYTDTSTLYFTEDGLDKYIHKGIGVDIYILRQDEASRHGSDVIDARETRWEQGERSRRAAKKLDDDVYRHQHMRKTVFMYTREPGRGRLWFPRSMLNLLEKIGLEDGFFPIPKFRDEYMGILFGENWQDEAERGGKVSAQADAYIPYDEFFADRKVKVAADIYRSGDASAWLRMEALRISMSISRREASCGETAVSLFDKGDYAGVLSLYEEYISSQQAREMVSADEYIPVGSDNADAVMKSLIYCGRAEEAENLAGILSHGGIKQSAETKALADANSALNKALLSGDTDAVREALCDACGDTLYAKRAKAVLAVEAAQHGGSTENLRELICELPAGDAWMEKLRGEYLLLIGYEDDGVSALEDALRLADGSPLADIINARLNMLALPAPAGLNCTRNTHTGFLVQWDEVQGAAGYELRTGDRPDDCVRLIGSTEGECRLIAEGFKPGTGAYFTVNAYSRVAGEDGTQRLVPGHVSEAVYASAAPPAPSDIITEITPSPDTEVQLSWDPAYGADEYGIYRSEVQDGEYILLARTADTEYHDAAIELGVTYYYYVQGFVHSDDGEVAGDPSETAEAAPKYPAVKNLAGETIDFTTIKLTWKGIEGADGYQVYCSRTRKGGYTRTGMTAIPECYIPGRKTGENLFYRVRAYFIVDGIMRYGAFCKPLVKKAIPEPPAGIRTQTDENNRLTVKWHRVAGSTGYFVYRAGQDGEFTYVGKTKKEEWNDEARGESGTFTYRIRAYKREDGETVRGEYSAEFTA